MELECSYQGVALCWVFWVFGTLRPYFVEFQWILVVDFNLVFNISDKFCKYFSYANDEGVDFLMIQA